MSRVVLGVFGVLGALAAGLAPPAWAAAPEVEIDGFFAIVKPVTPGGTVLLTSLWRQVDEEGLVRLHRIEELIDDADGNGIVSLDAEIPIPPLSVWVAVDLTTGQVGFGSGAGLSVREIPDPPSSPGGTQESTEVGIRRGQVDLVLARPGAGGSWQAWMGEARDGNTSDADGTTDGLVVAGVSALTHSLHTPESAPASFLSTDVLVAVDPRTLDVKVIRFNAPGGV